MNIKQRIKEFKAGPILLIASIIFAAGIGAAINERQYQASNKSSENRELHEGGFDHISPLLGCADFHDPSDSHIEDLMNNAVQNRINKGDITFASIYFRDLNNGPWIGINEKEKFTPASLLKVPLMITFLKVAENNPAILDQEILITNNSQTLSQNIIPLRTVEIGTSYKISDLLEYMIIYSDNRAANALLENIDDAALNEVYTDLGITEPDANNSENFMSVRDYASFFRILYNSSYLNREMSERALSILTRSQFTSGISAGVPSQIEVAHKFGERVLVNGKQLHDCGIVYKTDKPYLICIMTRGNDFARMSTAIKELSEITYREFK